jgi:DNA-binding NarL/FixJ family response regulator
VEAIRRQAAGPAAMPESLTPREREVLQHIVLGETNHQIAAVLFLSVKTVEWHRSNLMSKLGMHSVADLVRYALRHGLVEESE